MAAVIGWLALAAGCFVLVTVRVAFGFSGRGAGAALFYACAALFIPGFSLRSSDVQRVFALVELLRGVAVYLFVLGRARLSRSDLGRWWKGRSRHGARRGLRPGSAASPVHRLSAVLQAESDPRGAGRPGEWVS